MAQGQIEIPKAAFRVKEAAAVYGVSKTKLYELMGAGQLKSVMVGGRRLIPRTELDALITPAQAA